MYDDDLKELEEGIRRLKVEYDIYFNGHRKKPPEDLRMRVERICKRLSEAVNMSYSERFRYTTLVTRYYVFRDRWRRSMMVRDAREAIKETPLPKPGKRPKRAPFQAGVEITICDPEAEEERIRQLYEVLCKISADRAAPVLSYERFREYISSHARTMQERFKCTAVVFQLALEADSIKFTAKAANE